MPSCRLVSHTDHQLCNLRQEDRSANPVTEISLRNPQRNLSNSVIRWARVTACSTLSGRSQFGRRPDIQACGIRSVFASKCCAGIRHIILRQVLIAFPQYSRKNRSQDKLPSSLKIKQSYPGSFCEERSKKTPVSSEATFSIGPPFGLRNSAASSATHVSFLSELVSPILVDCPRPALSLF